MKKIFNTKIIYKVKRTHPDIGDMPEELWKDKIFTYEDEYYINTDYFWGEDHIVQSIKEALMLTAGGGYNWKHIYDVKFEIEEVV